MGATAADDEGECTTMISTQLWLLCGVYSTLYCCFVFFCIVAALATIGACCSSQDRMIRVEDAKILQIDGEMRK